ncbi:hypothetical protein ACEQ8H_004658 [Pleosporales sp. CAS-2024a]
MDSPTQHHPLTLYGLPLLFILLAPSLYDIFSPEHMRSIRDSQLHEIASLMDDIYATLVNMTFIPETAIKRGPHKINTDSIPCQLNTEAFRAMELLPYVDKFEVHQVGDAYGLDWLYGGEFVDYRDPQDYYWACHPLHSWYDLLPESIALTSWGSGGWNGDETNAMLYDTWRNRIRVFEGEDWVHICDEDALRERPDSHYHDYTRIGLFNHSIERPIAARTKDDWEGDIWLDAPKFLRRILDAYQTLAWTPWETSNREGGWGIPNDIIKDLLRAHGWPANFDPSNFNAAFIRAKHAHATQLGPAAQAVYQRLGDLVGSPDRSDPGSIEDMRRVIISLDSQKNMNHHVQEQWFYLYRAQAHRWLLNHQEQELVAVKEEYARLCPNQVCVKPGDEILWEFHSIAQDWDKMQRSPSPEQTCKDYLVNFVDFAAPSDRYGNCVSKRTRDRSWLSLAYNLSKADALAHCALTSCNLIPQVTLKHLVGQQIAMLEARIHHYQSHLPVMRAWLPALRDHATKARDAFEADASAAAAVWR